MKFWHHVTHLAALVALRDEFSRICGQEALASVPCFVMWPTLLLFITRALTTLEIFELMNQGLFDRPLSVVNVSGDGFLSLVKTFAVKNVVLLQFVVSACATTCGTILCSRRRR